eukprot:TRINITY_DN880_c0_g1_i3.p1 TRINITY_DN880_c0_g1~~TRINITY_DN880_c0_g1_i3.p1  ORF type:complete len:163 (+),score=33.61 TRINITY_DN880_c0_g1_i3:532-1020(+)
MKAFLPDMVKRNDGFIVNVASSAGAMGIAGIADYCASKAASRMFSEGVRFELRNNGSNVKVCTICPYAINTALFDGITFNKVSEMLFPMLSVDEVVPVVISSIENRVNEEVYIPRHIGHILFLLRLVPTPLYWFTRDLTGTDSSMRTWMGRGTEFAMAKSNK